MLKVKGIGDWSYESLLRQLAVQSSAALRCCSKLEFVLGVNYRL